MIEAIMIDAEIIRRRARSPAKSLSMALPVASTVGEFASLLLELSEREFPVRVNAYC
jgi:hypothetical protein